MSSWRSLILISVLLTISGQSLSTAMTAALAEGAPKATGQIKGPKASAPKKAPRSPPDLPTRSQPSPIQRDSLSYCRADWYAVVSPDRLDQPPPATGRALLYPPPNYQSTSELIRLEADGVMPLSRERVARLERPILNYVIVPERLDCSPEGNWLIAYVASLDSSSISKNTWTIRLRERLAINNYYGAGNVSLSELRTLNARVRCNATDTACVACANAGGPNNCSSQQLYQLHCQPAAEGQSGRCVSYTERNWWCSPRHEFCSARVRFDDWNGSHAPGALIQISADTVKQPLYFLGDGFIPVLENIYTRFCGVCSREHWVWAVGRGSDSDLLNDPTGEP